MAATPYPSAHKMAFQRLLAAKAFGENGGAILCAARRLRAALGYTLSPVVYGRFTVLSDTNGEPDD